MDRNRDGTGMEKPVNPYVTRRAVRELAVQFLYQFDMSGGSLDEALALFWETQEEVGEMGHKFAEELVRGVMEKRAAIDEKIAKYTENWDLPRIAAVDRNILRLGHVRDAVPRRYPARRQHQ